MAKTDNAQKRTEVAKWPALADMKVRLGSMTSELEVRRGDVLVARAVDVGLSYEGVVAELMVSAHYSPEKSRMNCDIRVFAKTRHASKSLDEIFARLQEDAEANTAKLAGLIESMLAPARAAKW